MKSKAFANFTLTYLPAIGLILFLGIFIGVILWTFRSQSKDFYKKLSKIPLEKDSNHE